MDKSNKNILEAGITPTEFDDLFANDITIEEYLTEYPLQAHRYSHLADLAVTRGEKRLAEYFRSLSGKPKFVDWCD